MELERKERREVAKVGETFSELEFSRVHTHGELRKVEIVQNGYSCFSAWLYIGAGGLPA